MKNKITISPIKVEHNSDVDPMYYYIPAFYINSNKLTSKIKNNPKVKRVKEQTNQTFIALNYSCKTKESAKITASEFISNFQ